MIFIPLMLPMITVKPGGSLMFRAQVRLKTVDMNMNDILVLASRMICFLLENVFHTYRFIFEY